MKTIELNIGLHSKTHGAINPCKVLNALTGRGFVLLQYRTAQSSCEDGAEPCLAVRVGISHDRSLDNAYASLHQLAIAYGQDCIAYAGFCGPKPYAGINGALWISPDAPLELSPCQAMQAKHAAKALEIAHKVIASLPEPYQDALYQAAAAQYHARQSGQGPSFEVRP